MTARSPANGPSVPIVRGLAETIAALPHLLGYRPVDSVVVMMLQAIAGRRGKRTGKLGMTIRVDIPPPGQEEELVAALGPLLEREQPDAVAVISFEDTLDATRALAELQACAERLGIVVEGPARVRGDRWCHVGAPGGAAVQWLQVPTAQDVPATAELVLQGLAPGPDRAALEHQLRHGQMLSRRAVLDRLRQPGVAADTAQDRWRAGALALAAILPAAAAESADHGGGGASALSVDELCQLTIALHDAVFRDAVICWLCPGQLSPARLPEAVLATLVQTLPACRTGHRGHLITELTRLAQRVPVEVGPPVLTLLAQTAWWQGNGTLANLAVAQALRADPTYRLAGLLDELLQRCVPPVRPSWAV